MGSAGCGCAALAALLALVTALPFLGWGNWFLTVPTALAAIVFSARALARNEQVLLAVLGLAGGTGVLLWALFRLSIGGGLL